MKKHYRHENDCLNCGTNLVGYFCHNCGQENLEMKESFGHMAAHAVSDYFHFDYQFLNTLKPLLVKPGKLSNDYMAGKRVQYLHPVKMYIFISLLFFVLVFQDNKNDPEPNNAIAQNIKSDVNSHIGKHSSITAAQKNNPKKGIGRAAKDTAKGNSLSVTVKNNDNNSEKTIFAVSADKNDTYDNYIARQNKLAESERDNWFAQYFKKKTYDWRGKKDAKEVFKESFKHNLPKMMFILLPLCALILKLAFWRSHKLYFEHLIYTIHLHCCLFLTFIILMIFHLMLPASLKEIIDTLNIAALIYGVWYIYKSLKVVYQRTAFRTITKMVGVSMMYFFALGVCFMVIIAFTAIFSA